jgi:deoxycytidine triphosphate deaminase
MLTASEIAALIERGEIAWPGELRGDGLLLRLGSPLQLLADPGHVIDLANQPSIDTLYTQPVHDWDECELAPGQMVLCAAGHPLRLGPAFAAAIAGLSHLARVGLSTHVASPWVMPGWDGHLTFELPQHQPCKAQTAPGHAHRPCSHLAHVRCHPPSNPARPLRSARATRQPLRRRVRRPAHS